MNRYCDEILPSMLVDACGVDTELAHQIGVDVLDRAEAFAAQSAREQDVLVALFVEEVFDHEPLDASLGLKATVTVVVRNSLLEQAHHDGPLGSGIIAVSRCAAGPLSHFMAARRRQPVGRVTPGPFAGLPARYPRAWACLSALTEVFAAGGPAGPETTAGPDAATADRR
jgi:hypothetical protein